MRYSKPRYLDLTGTRFGRLVVIRFDHTNGRGRIYWWCRCDCGVEKAVRGGSLTERRTFSCGCYNRELSSEKGRKYSYNLVPETRQHGMAGSRTYKSWIAAVYRCTVKGSTHWKRYGGRGVKVCDRWLKFENFYADMGERPEGKTLDRFPDGDGDYQPGNCRWATPKEQAANRPQRNQWTGPC